MGVKPELRDNNTKRHCMTKDRLKYLLDRYLDNTATPAELEEYNEWYNQQGDAVKLFEQPDSVEAQAYSRELFGKIMQNINDHAPVRRRHYIQYIKWAAAAILTGAVFMLFNNTRSRQADTVVQPPVAAVKEEMVIIENHTAGKKQVRLKDGSLAELFTGSTLRFGKSFGTTERQIYLTGKGFFDVAKDPSKPFTVNSRGIATTALGTSFTITAYTGKNEIMVSLHTGRVVVKGFAAHNGRKEIYLDPGQQLSCNIVTGKTKTGQITERIPTGTGVPVPGSRTGFAASFDQAPLDSVLNTISKGYGVHVQYDRKELSAMLFSGSIRETDSLSQVLKRIGVLYNLSVKPAGKQFSIRKSH
jgi:ferric-dicitrate binding protein FerR (iron transport regulator)